MVRRLGEALSTRRALVVIVAALFVLAWAVPSLGKSTAKLARIALGRANQAFHNADLAIDTSNNAKSTANAASATASSAAASASSARTTANGAQSTANQALAIANGSAHVVLNFTRSFDPDSIGATSCTSFPFTELGVLSTDEVIVTPPDTQPLGILVQALTASNQVTLEFCNVTGGAIDPPSGAYEFSILR